ncbi:hypothetical protein HJG54_07495 [Leptolyngbya sp. NK1-12]|uniref:Uncharacterized protein n=1 Tax=Leptolyngbya sp. NK1-12 TaxID=2547451 RepID=A0AA96WCP3_9CYAN|nr:hypothetical protein [Leptolyngbya sp. NK1-12]WNZ22714.1 hypothetical protein HJG54_07495 [Leptolyngbya sp. NK1-12]
MSKKTAPKPKPLPSNAELVTVDEAARMLGRGYSRRSIFRRIKSGEWQEGIHWIDDRRQDSDRRIIKINLTAVQELRGTPAAFR